MAVHAAETQMQEESQILGDSGETAAKDITKTYGAKAFSLGAKSDKTKVQGAWSKVLAVKVKK